MRLVLSDIWSKRAQAILIAILALSMNVVMPVPGGAQSTVNPQTSSQQQSIKQVTPSKQPSQKSTPKSNLPSTGPGDVVAIFVISSLLAAIVYRRWLLYRHVAHQ